MSFTVSKKSFFAIPIALISIEIYLGIIIGYFCGKFFAGKYDGCQRVKSIFINIGRYTLHIHHWIASIVIGVFAAVFNLFPFFSPFFFGVLGGLVIQDFYLDEDWRHVIIKK